MSRSLRSILSAAFVFLLSACGGGDSSGPSGNAPTKLALTVQPSTVTSGAAIAPAVQVVVQNAQGNSVAGSTASITLAITSGSGVAGAVLGGTLTRAAVNGVATFDDLTIDKAGDGYSLTATATSLTSATSGVFVVNAGPATKLALTVQPITVIGGAAINPAVQVMVQDAHGNSVTGSTASITLSITSGSGVAGAVLGGTVTRAAVNGVATFNDLTIDKAGAGYSLTATATGLSNGVSGAFVVNAGPATKLALTVQRSPVMGGIAITPAVQVVVQDAQGNSVPGSTPSITLAITNGTGAAGAVLGGTLTRAAVNGVATFNDLTIDKAGAGYSLTATASGLTIGVSGAFSVVLHKDVPVESFLATPIAGAIWTVPVTVLAYLPTVDGVNIDVRRSPDFYVLGPLSLAVVEARILEIIRRKKMSLEQGSRFRGYSNPTALPSIGIRVVSIRFVYDIVPASPTFKINGMALPDYNRIVPEQGLDTLINSKGVRQVWLSQVSVDASFPSYDPAIHSAADFRYVDESNMSSALTGDISNSYRLNDLPILSHPYIVYGINWRRSQAEAVHNVGHQLEAQYAFIAQRQDGNSRLFWRQFVGQNTSDQFVTGRTGWTHMPPNTVVSYDYLNATAVASDIQDWRPDNGGAKTNASVSTWANQVHPWPGEADFGQRTESQWYIYWFQSMPGRGNTIPHGTNWMTNWWAFTGDWHAAVNANLGLYAGTPAASVGTGPTAEVRVVDPEETAREAARWPVKETRPRRR